MKITTHIRPQGSALLLTLLTAFVICIALTTYLYLVSNQNRSVMRSLAWNSAIPVVEAGVEEALTQVNYVGSTNLAVNGWGAMSADGFYHKYNDLGNGFAYDVGVKPPLAFGPDQPTIESIGYAPAPANIASSYSGMILGGLVPQYSPAKTSAKRKVRVLAKRQTPVQFAMLAKGQIDLHGNNIATDSFNSTNSTYSTNGRYDAGKSRDHGDIATNAQIVNGLNAGNANIKGHASTGPSGSVAIGNNGAIGDKAWVDGNNKGVQGGHVSDDTNVEIPEVFAPFTTGVTPIGGQFPLLTGPTYDYILTNGNYILSSFTGKVLVIGSAKLLVNSSFSFTGQDQITINQGASLDVYVAAASAELGGNGVANIQGDAISFAYYGLKSNTSLKFSGNTAFTGVVYAPYADFTLGGGGNNAQDFVGASVTKTSTLNGHFNFHYDESLAGRFPIRRYVVYSWNELGPNE